jgi:hypothetical protein
VNQTNPLSWIPSPSMNPTVRGSAAIVTVDGREMEVCYGPTAMPRIELTEGQKIMETGTSFFVVGGDRPSSGEWFERDEPQPAD